MYKLFLYGFLWLANTFIFLNVGLAQGNVILYPDLYYRIETSQRFRPDSHTVFQPQYLSIQVVRTLADSIYGTKDKDFIQYRNDRINLVAQPILQSTFRTGTPFLHHEVVGFRLSSEFGKKLSLDLNYSMHLITNHAFPESRLDSAGIIDHWGKSTTINSDLRFFNSLNGKITFTPIRALSFELGKDKHMWGDGYRSLFLSDNAPSYPFLATTLQVWKIRYTHMVTILEDDTLGNYQKLHRKYAAMHFLSWNITKRLNLNFFETVIWYKRNDSISHRGLDVNYLNPFLFYRPLEYNLGSPDNVLVGFGFHYLIGKQGMIYGQLMLDEFHLKEIKNGKQWWGNKDAIQIGGKYMNLFTVKNLYLQVEYNQARPFTYGHSYPLQNYGYLLQPMAHPLGTNFREGLFIVRYAKERWFFHSVMSFNRYGLEPGGKTVGADIYLSSKKIAKVYGNYIGQGITVNELTEEIKLSRMLQSKWGLVGEIGAKEVLQFLPGKNHQTFFTFGLRTLLYREEKLF